MKLDKRCCGKFRKEGKACRRCPLMASLTKKERQKCLAKAKKRREKAA